MNRTKSQDWNQAVLDRTIDRSPEADEATSAAADLKDALGSLRGDEWDFVVKGVQRSSGGLTLKLMMRPNGDT